MKSPYLSELQPNQTVQGTFLVSYKDVRQKKSGDPYLSLTLSDRSGELDAKMWDNAAEVLDTFQRDDFVRIKGLLQSSRIARSLRCTRSSRWRSRKSIWPIICRPPNATGTRCSSRCKAGSRACPIRI